MVMEKAKDYPQPVPAFMQAGSSPTPAASLNFDTDGQKGDADMVLKWSAAWYEQDQTIIVGDKAWFCLPSDEKNHSFITDFYQRNSFIRKKLDIEWITHG